MPKASDEKTSILMETSLVVCAQSSWVNTFCPIDYSITKKGAHLHKYAGVEFFNLQSGLLWQKCHHLRYGYTFYEILGLTD